MQSSISFTIVIKKWIKRLMQRSMYYGSMGFFSFIYNLGDEEPAAAATANECKLVMENSPIEKVENTCKLMNKLK